MGCESLQNALLSHGSGVRIPVTRLLAQGYQKLTGEPVTLRFGPGHVICPALIALPYWVELDTRFDGKHRRRCTPDDIGDYVQMARNWLWDWSKGGI